MADFVFDPHLTKHDGLVLKVLESDLVGDLNGKAAPNEHGTSSQSETEEDLRQALAVQKLQALNDPKNEAFEPTVFTSVDLDHLHLPILLDKYLLQPYIRLARSIVRVETDVVMVRVHLFI
ncbi:hypothetical protein VPNG_03440 [Cytospora leucostoma]|uniref:Uncharacterized protein n=1 Tax=Cytospora leucostoma TaxID=1230097 RepID=A0A423XFY1_9PEZI|nr:hypothetical protein VPNG_03440 [Cytospora leucostoma]